MVPRPLLSSLFRSARRAARAGAPAVLLLAVPALARDPVILAGEGREVALPAEALRALPSETLTVAYLTSRGPERVRVTGPRLWDILTGQGLLDTDLHGALARSLVVITAGDGYRLVLAAGDLAPELGDAPVLLAHAREGEPIAAARAPRLVVPGDRRGARQMFDVARIEVRVIDAASSDPTRQENTP